MRLRFRWLLLLIIIGLVAHTVLRSRLMSASVSEPVRVPPTLLDGATRGPAFVVESERWLDFDLPDNTERLRVLTNANLDSIARQLTNQQLNEAEWNYCIRYQLLGLRNVVIDEGTYAFRTKLDRHFDPVTRQTFPVRFFDEQQSCLTITQELNIACRHEKQHAQRLRIRLEPCESTAKTVEPSGMNMGPYKSIASIQATPTKLTAMTNPIHITEVVARLYCLCDRPASRLTQSWRRLSDDQKKRLVAGSIYPHELTDEQSRLNLLRSLWHPAAPLGQVGVGYQQRTLFTLHGAESYAIRPPQQPLGGFRIQPEHHGMIPIPEGGGTLTLHFGDDFASTADRPSTTKELQRSIELRWFGSKAHERRNWKVDLPLVSQESPDRGEDGPSHRASTITATYDDVTAEWHCSLPVRGGLFQVITATPMFLRATWIADDAADNPEMTPIEVTPRPSVLRSYLASQTDPVEFSITHLDEHPSPIKISIRAIRNTGNVSGAAMPFQWRMLDEHGVVLGSGPVTATAEWSQYDRMLQGTSDSNSSLANRSQDHEATAPYANAPAEGIGTSEIVSQATLANESSVPLIGLSEPVDFHFLVPNRVNRLVILATESPLLVTASSRPSDIARRTDVPEDYAAFSRRKSDNRSWFSMRALSHLSLIKEGRAPFVALQPRPPVDDVEMAAGRYSWQDFHPAGNWKARYVLSERDPEQPTAESTASVLYKEIAQSVPHRIEFMVEAGSSTTSPGMAYQFTGSTLAPIDVLVNGVLHHRIKPQSTSGELILPPVTATSDHSLEVRFECSEPLRIWMNRIRFSGDSSNEAKSWLKRLAIEVPTSEMIFPIRKATSGEERLSLRLFRPLGSSGRASIHVLIDSPFKELIGQPTASQTLMRRLYSTAPSPDTSSLLLSAGNAALLDGSRVCIIPLGEDLPPGDYWIRVRVEFPDGHNAGSYLILSQTTSGETDRRDFDVEVIREVEQ